ncbi:hypothetical protein BABINDRAFT_128216 [Babjeviella inositovora NRRL Y-12698]|uniref:Uncharacterized protein n=1 Tax=Babjeviella inositovora NRRL Y-12698 TaxID=984486 RepID=A0A1E3QT58_9ASCO|nr:uncharacterized protein BABINDRAFT_128216 [Babjeviella inositovora NRRL Y-12698]ODQ80879.1 hypothetical protein BABINDRAFT_128216 [Babjeviella inositovora NRRL Y-12698]
MKNYTPASHSHPEKLPSHRNIMMRLSSRLYPNLEKSFRLHQTARFPVTRAFHATPRLQQPATKAHPEQDTHYQVCFYWNRCGLGLTN